MTQGGIIRGRTATIVDVAKQTSGEMVLRRTTNYSRPPFPRELYTRFRGLAAQLGWSVRGQCWKLLAMLLDYAELHPELFRKR